MPVSIQGRKRRRQPDGAGGADGADVPKDSADMLPATLCIVHVDTLLFICYIHNLSIQNICIYYIICVYIYYDIQINTRHSWFAVDASENVVIP